MLAEQCVQMLHSCVCVCMCRTRRTNAIDSIDILPFCLFAYYYYYKSRACERVVCAARCPPLESSVSFRLEL